MIISLGSTSEDKKNVLLVALESLQIPGELTCCNVSSGISDQPLDEPTTIEGARNRARAALTSHPEAELGIGMEGGLAEVNSFGYFLVCAVVIIDKNGKEYVGISAKLRLPTEVSDKVKAGEQFGEAVREYESTHATESALMTELISRRQSFTEAVRNAVTNYANEAHFA